MTAFDLCGKNSADLEGNTFTIGKSKVEWESAVYKDRCNKVEISRVVENGGRSFLMGLGYKTRYVPTETKVKIVISK